MNFDHKILSLSSLKDDTLDRTKKIVLVGGCFDILHFGHIAFLKKARKAGDLLVVLLESDEFIMKIKKKQPVHTQEQRAEILAALGYVDFILCLPFLKNPDIDYKKIVLAISPSVIAYTTGDSKEMQKKKFAHLVNAVTLSVPHLSSFSSSKLITYAPLFRD